jgi:hypothetical protein
MRGVSYDVRDDLWDAGFQLDGIKYRKKFKTKEKAEEWLTQKKDEVKKERRNGKLSSTKLCISESSPLAALWDNSTTCE